MSQDQFATYRRKVRQMGPWTGVRYLRNRGVEFADAHRIVLGFPPRFA